MRKIVLWGLCAFVALSVAAQESLETRLWEAAEKGNVEVVRRLTQEGANVNSRRDDGATALTLSAREGHTGVVRELLRSGADAEANGWALLLAAERGQLEIVQELIRAGAPVNTEPNTWTPLMGASQNGHAEMVQHLLNAGADVNARADDGATALAMAVSGRHANLVRILIQSGAKANIRLPEGSTPLIIATRNGDAATVKELILAGADPTQQDNYGKTAAYWAIWSKNAEVIQMMRAQSSSGEALVANLRNPDRATRYSAVVGLGMPGNVRAVKPLATLLQTERDAEVRSAAVTSLGVIGDAEATPALITIIETDPALANRAIESLILIKDRKAVPALRKQFWNERNSNNAMRALPVLDDYGYVMTANRMRRNLAFVIPLLVALAVVLFAFLSSRGKRLELLRLGIALMNSLAGFLLGFSLFFLIVLFFGSAIGTINTRGEWAFLGYVSLAFFYGRYCAFFCFLGTYLRVKKWRNLSHSILMGALPVVLSPFVLISMSNIYVDENDAVTSRWTDFISGFRVEQSTSHELLLILLASFCAVFLDSLIVSGLLNRLRQNGLHSRLDHLTQKEFLLFSVVLSLPFLLHTPLARIATNLFL